MPKKHYRGTSYPPRLWERALSHPMELVMSLIGAVPFGTALILGEVLKHYVPSPPVENLNHWQGVLMGSSLLLGGIATVISLLYPLPDIELEWLVERFGLMLMFWGWTTYFVAVFIWAPDYQGIMLTSSTMATMCLARFLTTFIIEHGPAQVFGAIVKPWKLLKMLLTVKRTKCIQRRSDRR